MGAEQSNSNNQQRIKEKQNDEKEDRKVNRLQKRYTIQAGEMNIPGTKIENRPNSPPISVCSDSDLPYISYTDRIQISDSPKIRGKNQTKPLPKQSVVKPKFGKEKQQAAHNIIIVKSAVKELNLESDPDFIKLQLLLEGNKKIGNA